MEGTKSFVFNLSNPLLPSSSSLMNTSNELNKTHSPVAKPIGLQRDEQSSSQPISTKFNPAEKTLSYSEAYDVLPNSPQKAIIYFKQDERIFLRYKARSLERCCGSRRGVPVDDPTIKPVLPAFSNLSHTQKLQQMAMKVLSPTEKIPYNLKNRIASLDPPQHSNPSLSSQMAKSLRNGLLTAATARTTTLSGKTSSAAATAAPAGMTSSKWRTSTSFHQVGNHAALPSSSSSRSSSKQLLEQQYSTQPISNSIPSTAVSSSQLGTTMIRMMKMTPRTKSRFKTIHSNTVPVHNVVHTADSLISPRSPVIGKPATSARLYTAAVAENEVNLPSILEFEPYKQCSPVLVPQSTTHFITQPQQSFCSPRIVSREKSLQLEQQQSSVYHSNALMMKTLSPLKYPKDFEESQNHNGLIDFTLLKDKLRKMKFRVKRRVPNSKISDKLLTESEQQSEVVEKVDDDFDEDFRTQSQVLSLPFQQQQQPQLFQLQQQQQWNMKSISTEHSMTSMIAKVNNSSSKPGSGMRSQSKEIASSESLPGKLRKLKDECMLNVSESPKQLAKEDLKYVKLQQRVQEKLESPDHSFRQVETLKNIVDVASNYEVAALLMHCCKSEHSELNAMSRTFVKQKNGIDERQEALTCRARVNRVEFDEGASSEITFDVDKEIVYGDRQDYLDKINALRTAKSKLFRLDERPKLIESLGRIHRKRNAEAKRMRDEIAKNQKNDNASNKYNFSALF